MHRIVACLLVVCMLVSSAAAVAESTFFSMAGYDPQESGHVWDDNLFFRRMAEKTGIDFHFNEYTDEEEWTRAKAGYTAGGELPEVLFKAELTNDETLALYEKGVLVDLKPYLAEHAPNLSALLAEHPEWEKAISLPDGAIAALPQINMIPTNNAIWINATWLNRLKLDMPSTPEAFLDVLRAFKTQDPNRNGKNDEVPLTFTGLWDLKFLAHAFGLIPNDYGMEVVDGKVVFDYTTERYREFLAFLHTMYEEKLVDPYGFTSLDTTRQITDTKAAITYGVVFGPTIMSMLPTSAIADYKVLVMGEEGKRVYRSLVSEVTRGTFAVTSACKDIGKILSWVDFLYTDEGCFLATSGVEGDEYEKTSDGYWYWLDDIEYVQSSVLVDSTIAEGATAPMYMSAEYQLMFDDETTRSAVVELSELSRLAKLPYPLTFMTAETKKEIASIWEQLGSWCEIAMTGFVTGDVELNDETWSSFCAEAEQRGASRLTDVFQKQLN